METFDDPNLKAALKRTQGGETAPAGLRERVLFALDESDESSREALFKFRGWNLGGQKLGVLAMAAAVVLMVVGYAVYQGMHGGIEGGAGGGKVMVAALPKPFAEAMISGHDSAASSPEFASPCAADPKTIAQSLAGQVAVKPLVALPTDSGWTLRGAKAASVNNVTTAQAVLAKGDAKVSIFSVPARAVYSPQDGATYDQVTNGHPIAGFVRKDAMYCIVGDAGASLDAVKKLATLLDQSTRG